MTNAEYNSRVNLAHAKAAIIAANVKQFKKITIDNIDEINSIVPQLTKPLGLGSCGWPLAIWVKQEHTGTTKSNQSSVTFRGSYYKSEEYTNIFQKGWQESSFYYHYNDDGKLERFSSNYRSHDLFHERSESSDSRTCFESKHVQVFEKSSIGFTTGSEMVINIGDSKIESILLPLSGVVPDTYTLSLDVKGKFRNRNSYDYSTTTGHKILPLTEAKAALVDTQLQENITNEYCIIEVHISKKYKKQVLLALKLSRFLMKERFEYDRIHVIEVQQEDQFKLSEVNVTIRGKGTTYYRGGVWFINYNSKISEMFSSTGWGFHSVDTLAEPSDTFRYVRDIDMKELDSFKGEPNGSMYQHDLKPICLSNKGSYLRPVLNYSKFEKIIYVDGRGNFHMVEGDKVGHLVAKGTYVIQPSYERHNSNDNSYTVPIIFKEYSTCSLFYNLISGDFSSIYRWVEQEQGLQKIIKFAEKHSRGFASFSEYSQMITYHIENKMQDCVFMREQKRYQGVFPEIPNKAARNIVLALKRLRKF